MHAHELQPCLDVDQRLLVYGTQHQVQAPHASNHGYADRTCLEAELFSCVRQKQLHCHKYKVVHIEVILSTQTVVLYCRSQCIGGIRRTCAGFEPGCPCCAGLQCNAGCISTPSCTATCKEQHVAPVSTGDMLKL
jgi:hypothetical protein